MDAEMIIPGLTMGEAAVLIGQMMGMPAERVGGWAVIMQPLGTADVAILSSENCVEHGYDRPATVHMLLDAVQQMVNELDEYAPRDGAE